MILPVSIRRTPDQRFHVSYAPVVTVASSSPADLQRATQAIADALEATVGAAPDQWYSFKPMWPPTQAEAAELEARAAAMLADDGSERVHRGVATSPASPAADVAGAGPTAADAVDAPAVDPHLRTAEA
jgi:hypothetical protein